VILAKYSMTLSICDSWSSCRKCL